MDLYGQHDELNLLPNTFGLSPAGAVANIANREEFTWDEVYYIHYYCANIGVPKPWDVSITITVALFYFVFYFIYLFYVLVGSTHRRIGSFLSR
jgi:hypothetical protein